MEYMQLTLEEYNQSKEGIKKDLGGIAKGFVRAGWRLTRINATEAYKMDGYKSLAEFAKAEYGMNPSGATRFMKVYEKYSIPGDTPELQERYKDYNFSQLTEMLQISDEAHEIFGPEAKRDSIREYQKFERENENNPDNLLNWKKEPEDILGKTIMEFFRNNKELLNGLFGSEAYRTGDMKAMVEIINPGGNKHYRHKTMFLMMYSFTKGLMISEFGKQPEDMSWEKFFAVTQEIFGEAAAGEHTWENYFAENEEAQIPGQDNVMNHPELCPGNEEMEEEQQIAPAQKTEEAAPEEFEPQPESMISICYSCEHWSECNMKSNTVNDCNEYVCKVEKAEEQKYSEEQDRIDKETKKKLQEREDEEKMQSLPSDKQETGPKVHQVRLAKTYFDDVAAGIKSFELRKNDRGYKVGDILEMMEFSEGRNTGRLIRAEATYILEDYTGIEDGYCIMAIKVVEVCE